MWSRERFKARAKQVLSHNYWLSFGACIVVTLIISFAGGTSSGVIQSMAAGMGLSSATIAGLSESPEGMAVAIMGALGFIFMLTLIMSAVGLAITFFLNGPLYVGLNKFFLESRKGNCEFQNTFSSFTKNGYISIVKAMAWRELFLILWTMLFYIPGIIKTFSYFLVPYIMADNPQMDYRRALKLSMQMTDGYKWDIFVLELSFIGWYLLGMLCCGVGTFFVVPYIYATNAEMYAHLRKNAMEKGYCTPAELNLTQIDYNLDYNGQN